MFKVAKFITINVAKTSAEKCTKGCKLLAKIKLCTSCSAYLQTQYLRHMHVQPISKCTSSTYVRVRMYLCKSSSMYVHTHGT